MRTIFFMMIGFTLCGCIESVDIPAVKPRGKDGSRFGVEETVMVTEVVASSDIPAGTVIEDPHKLFNTGKLRVESESVDGKIWKKNKEVADLFPSSWLSSLVGKKVGRNLQRGEIVKKTDILEADGSPFRKQ